jgi:hypothetical protein
MLWLLWIALTVPSGLLVLAVIFYGGNRSFLLIGKTTHGHHQIELACDACHTSLFGGPEVLQDACVGCHGAELKAANDTHPISKFLDPRNADRLAALDARYCVTCHQEHRPGITRVSGVTLPEDYCFHCHQDIAKERPSHEGLAFTTCASAGCHNYHDNRALYEAFLRDHAKQPPHLDKQLVALADWLAEKESKSKAARPLAAADADAPATHKIDNAIIVAWASDAHAAAGVNCSGCHTTKTEPDKWIAAPSLDACQSCHADQVRGFTEGRHGMRLRAGLFSTREGPFGLWKEQRLAPMTPAKARLPMKTDAHGTALGCNTCHAAHKYDVAAARVEACVSCHDDPHSKAYFNSPHHDLFKRELAGELPRGAGVTCASCHMPLHEERRPDGSRARFVNHNQNDNLRPNEKMVRSVCGHCHGLQFTLDALADPALIQNNFSGPPTIRIESIDWALRRAKERGGARR